MSWAPRVTVVVAARDAARTLDPCIASLRALRYPSDKVELVVVDNGSSDGTRDVLRRYDVRVVDEPRRGAAAARNAGIAAATGDVVAFTDADGTVDPGWVERLVAPLANDSVGAVGGPILALASAGAVERFGERIHDQQRSIEVFDPPYVATANWASRADLLRSLGGFDVDFRRGQDVDLSYRIVQAGYRLAYAPGAVVYHRNEATALGLAREGFAHGFHGVRVRKRHDAFLRGYGHGRTTRPTYRQIAASFVRGGSRYDAVFNAGKKAGKLAGSLRFRHLDL